MATATVADPHTPAAKDDRSPHLSRGQWTLLYGSFLAGIALTFDLSSDDPFITLRYAANVVHGYGAVFNPGHRVEGFTSPLHLLLVIGAYLAPGSHDLLKVKLLSLVFGAAALTVAIRLVRAAELPRWGVNVGLVLLGGSWSLAVSSANGLETTLACFLTTLLVAELVSGRALEKPLVAGLASAGLVAVRPEGILVTGCLVLASAMLEPQGATLWRRGKWFIGALASQVLIEVARLAYYGQLLPNTYYAKRGALGTDVLTGLQYLTSLQPGVPELLFVAEIGFVIVGAWTLARRPFPRRRWLYASAAVIAQVLAILETGRDWMRGDRFFVPVACVTTVLLVKGVVTLTEEARRKWQATSRALFVGTSASLLLVIAVGAIMPFVEIHDPVWESHGRLDDVSLVAAGGYRGFSDGVWTYGAAMLRCVPSGSLVAYSEIGFVGFERTDLRILDTRGLTDPSIAHAAAAADKSAPGVTERDWSSPRSVVGADILAAKPIAILSFDHEARRPLGRTVLGGSYVLVAQRKVRDLPLPAGSPHVLTLYERATELDRGVRVLCPQTRAD